MPGGTLNTKTIFKPFNFTNFLFSCDIKQPFLDNAKTITKSLIEQQQRKKKKQISEHCLFGVEHVVDFERQKQKIKERKRMKEIKLIGNCKYFRVSFSLKIY